MRQLLLVLHCNIAAAARRQGDVASSERQPKRGRIVDQAKQKNGSETMYIGIGGLILLIILLIILL